MKIKVFITGILVLLFIGAHGQTTAEWFDQKNTQKKYLMQQIAALKIYYNYVKKGYSIAHDGTGLISGHTGDEFNLHTGHFDNLKVVSPRVINYSKVRGSISLQQEMISAKEATLKKVRNSTQLNQSEYADLQKLYDSLSQASSRDIEELELVIKSGKLQMSNDERIGHIDKIYSALVAIYGAQSELNRNVLNLAAQRARGDKEATVVKKMYGF